VLLLYSPGAYLATTTADNAAYFSTGPAPTLAHARDLGHEQTGWLTAGFRITSGDFIDVPHHNWLFPLFGGPGSFSAQGSEQENNLY